MPLNLEGKSTKRLQKDTQGDKLKLVLDANVIFAMLIRDSHTRHLILRGRMVIFHPRISFRRIKE